MDAGAWPGLNLMAAGAGPGLNLMAAGAGPGLNLMAAGAGPGLNLIAAGAGLNLGAGGIDCFCGGILIGIPILPEVVPPVEGGGWEAVGEKVKGV